MEFLNGLQIDPALGLDFFGRPALNMNTDFLVAPKMINRVKKSLSHANLQYKIINHDFETELENERRSRSSRSNALFWTTYYTLEEIESWLNNISSTSNLVTLTEIGRSVENRPIRSVKVSSGPNKPAIWVECLAHAREWITGSVCLGTIDMLIKGYGSSSPETEMLNEFDWYFVPVLNPDGYVYSTDFDRLWRKNRANTRISSCKGVDLNRNWDIDHCNSGASTFPCQDVFCGSPNSEPETQALEKAVKSTDNTVAFFSMHSYSQLLLLPYAYTQTLPDDYNELKAVAETAMSALEGLYQTKYQVGSAANILYAASGGSYDYFRNASIKYSFVYELRPQSGTSNGFVLPETQITPTILETFASLASFASSIAAAKK